MQTFIFCGSMVKVITYSLRNCPEKENTLNVVHPKSQAFINVIDKLGQGNQDTKFDMQFS